MTKRVHGALGSDVQAEARKKAAEILEAKRLVRAPGAASAWAMAAAGSSRISGGRQALDELDQALGGSGGDHWARVVSREAEEEGPDWLGQMR